MSDIPEGAYLLGTMEAVHEGEYMGFVECYAVPEPLIRSVDRKALTVTILTRFIAAGDEWKYGVERPAEFTWQYDEAQP